VNSETLSDLNVHFRRVRPTEPNVLFLRGNARPDSRVSITQAITEFGWTLLPHTPHSPDAAQSDFRFFGPNDEAL
jgi:hypothetical protein